MADLNKHTCICNNCELAMKKSVFVGRGKKSEFRINNDTGKTVTKYIVDDCLLQSFRREEKCDFLFWVLESKLIYLVECKGSDVLKAVSQISSTLEVLKNTLKDYVLKGRIIPTRVNSPDLQTSSYRKLRERLKGDLIIKNIILTETI